MAVGSEERLNIRDEVATLKRERTISAAADLFYEKGYENTTLDEVAELLGVTKPFIYANFGSKVELLAEICERGIMAALVPIDRAIAEDLAPGASLELFASRYVTAILKSQKHIAIYTREEKNLDPADARRLGDLRRTFLGKIADLLQRGVDAGEFDVEDPKMAALAIVGAVSWSTFWYRPAGRLDASEIATVMTRFLLGLVGTNRAGTSRSGPRDHST